MTALANSSASAAKSQQLLLRLPDDLAQRFAQVVPSRQRSRFLLDLLRSELDRESLALAQAAKTLTELESGQPSLAAETAQWAEAPLASEDDADFNAEEFEREFAKAQASKARIEHIRAVDKSRLQRKLGKLSTQDLQAVEDALGRVLRLPKD